jgi:hypothetical protein
MSSILDLVMLVVEQSEPYQAPRAARAVDADADLAAIAFQEARCAACRVRPATGAGRGRPTGERLRSCGDPACSKEVDRRNNADRVGGGKVTGHLRSKKRRL